jgi:UDP-N-acetylglucosamine 4,6-dehydratase
MKYRTIAITGITGFLGQALIPFIIEHYKPESLRLLGRSEFKLAQIIRGNNFTYDLDQFRPLICDVRDRERVFSCLKDVDLVIHTAALKRLEIANYNPQEAIKTNIIGSMNVMDACLNVGVKKAIFISSDKAVKATNLYGKTKAVMESMVVERAKMVGNAQPTMCVVRYGNVIGSTGAVIPYFIKLAKEGKTLPITNGLMKRFLVTKRQALELVKIAIDKGKQGSIIIPKDLRAISVYNMALFILRYFKREEDFKIIGSWSGEKLYEDITESLNSDMVDSIGYGEFIGLLKEEGLL